MLPAGQARPPEAFRELLEKRASVFALALPDSALERLSFFLAELDLARRRTNLTGPLTASELVDHALESALGERLITHGAEVIDIGSGAGFPGFPLAAVRPDLCVTAVEPRRKRSEFLRGVASELPLDNFFVLEDRAERLPPGCWSVATARAVGSLERVLGQAPFLKPEGLFLSWTTDAEDLARRLAPHFALEVELPVPGSRRKRIAGFRKRNVPRGTG